MILRIIYSDYKEDIIFNQAFENDILHIKKKQDKYYLRFKSNSDIQEIKVYKHYQFHYFKLVLFEKVDDWHIYEKRAFSINKTKNYQINDQKYSLYFKDNEVYCNADLFVNNKLCNKRKIKNNDIIDFLDLKIICKEDFLYINQDLKSIIKKNILRSNIKYQDYHEQTSKNNVLDIETYQLGVLEKYQKPNKLSSTNLKSIIPSITMSFAMVLVSYLNLRESKGSKYSLIMPFTMLITTLLWPLIFAIMDHFKNRANTKKSIKEYLDYFKKYKSQEKEKLEKYLHYLNNFTIKELNNQHHFISINQLFLNIVIGYYQSEKLRYLSNEKVIDDEIKAFNEELSKYQIPYLLDFKKAIDIFVMQEEKIDYLIFALLYLNNQNDFYIALYKPPRTLIDKLQACVNLYFQNKRLVFMMEQDLEMLDKLDKAVILFSFELFNIKLEKNVYCVSLFKQLEKHSSQGKSYLKMLANENILICDNQEIKLKPVDYVFDYQLLKQKNNKNDYFNENKVFDIDVLDIMNNYQSNFKGLKAEFCYKKEVIALDLHESKDGPHGLIVGSTGSGKSELIISMLLSLCLRYSPLYLGIIIVDFKGDALTNSFKYQGQSLPHLYASVSNDQPESLERMLARIEYELNSRQKIFQNLAKKIGRSIGNIDEYNGVVDFEMTIPHLVVVFDEFAQIKAKNPKYLDLVMQMARIGRSLGLHLVLATQKPNGIIDSQTSANLSYKICLKVNEIQESKEIIGNEEAFYINQKGEFILKRNHSQLKLNFCYSGNDIKDGGVKKISILNPDLSENESISIYKKESISYRQLLIQKICLSALKYPKRVFDIQYHSNCDYHESERMFFGIIDDYFQNKKEIFCVEDDLVIYSETKDYYLSFIQKQKYIVISDLKVKSSTVLASLLYEDKENILFIFKKLKKEKQKLCLIIQDLYSFINYDEEYYNLLLEFLIIKPFNIQVIALTGNVNLNFKLLNYFKIKIYLSKYFNREQFNMFSNVNTKYIDRHQIIINNQVLPFIPLRNIKNLNNIENRSYLDLIPNHIVFERKEKLKLLGYDIDTRAKIFVDDSYVFIGYDKEILERYQKYFDNVFYYQNKVFDKPIIWLSCGLLRQNIIYSYFKEDLAENQGIYFKDKKWRVFRIIDE